MKKFIYILSIVLLSSLQVFAQDDDDNDGNEKIRDKMSEFVQNRLGLSKDEANKFSPVFLQYFKEWRQTIRENKSDRLVLQQRIVELRIRYRAQFRELLGEQRGNQVFQHQDIFIQKLRDERNDRLRNNPNRPIKRLRVNKLL